MSDKNRHLILEGNLIKAIMTLALPIMLNNFIGTLYNLGDAFWVSKLGDTEVAAVNFVWPVSFLITSIAIGISIAGASIISQYIGANNYESALETAQQLYIFAIVFGIFGSLVGFFVTPYVIKLMGATGGLYSQSIVYLKIIFFQFPFLFILNIFFSINQSQGDTLTPTLLNGASAILNIILDPLFIFVFNLGIQGAAIATVLSSMPFAAYALYRLSKGCRNIKIHPFNWNFLPSKMKDLIRIGIPSSLGNSGVAFGFIILFAFVVKYGENAMAAVGLGNRLNSLAFMPAVGVGAALSTIVGQNLGAGNIKRVKHAYRLSILVALSFLAVTGSILWFFSEELLMIFTKTQAVIDMGSFYLKALAATTWSIAFFNCSIGLFNGSGHTIYSMILESGRLWVIRIPMIILLGSYATLGEKAIWYSISSSNVIAAIVAVIFVFAGGWKKPKIPRI